VAYCGGVDLMLWFQLERGGDRMKHCQNIKWRHRAHLGSMERKYDTVWRCDDVGWRRGGTGKGKERRRYQLS
jgi:hypothetical protein